jgi:hypothetical protein
MPVGSEGAGGDRAVSAPAIDAYPGGELELFAEATNWKRYWAGYLRPYLGRVVLEVGAGIGSNTLELASRDAKWLCLEPDPALARRLAERIDAHPARGASWRIVNGTIDDLGTDARYDTIL